MTIECHLVAAARPNFMKIAPLYHAMKNTDWCTPILVHTGQHYDANMSDAFFRDLNLPAPEIHLGVGSGTHAEQTGKVMIAYEAVCAESNPDWVIVVGDVNSTIACALAAKKLLVDVAHLEAGLRSGDRRMPEEINRLATDAISDLLWTPSSDASDNLRREGVPDARIDLVGNIMIDSFELMRKQIKAIDPSSVSGMRGGDYAVVTLHRPSNVDHCETLSALVSLLVQISKDIKLVFPLHPRTHRKLQDFGLYETLRGASGIALLEPQGYCNFMSLVMGARFVMTDSGGIQEETSYLDIPCLTLRDTTERPITISHGSNRLVTLDG
jgi:UDP-N-acetylglucosamine 2-epimerase (non-hydrolysing)